ncbi:MAG TPA: hypothetical protein VLZ77_12840, partial [Acidimicrobiales bacterium]|nr:hypothetical protein [Acidimicrobiales bacterium]
MHRSRGIRIALALAVVVSTVIAGLVSGVLPAYAQTWVPLKAPLPAGPDAPAAPNPDAYLASVACQSDTACAAGGSYNYTATQFAGVIDTGYGPTASTWTSTEVMPADVAAAPNRRAGVDQVACPPTGDCVAIGNYHSSTTNSLIAFLDAGPATSPASSWALTPVQNGQLPAGGIAADGDGLDWVSCDPTGVFCAAVGGYSDASGSEGLIETGTGSSWTPVTASPGDTAGTYTLLRSVACPSASACVAAGQYQFGPWQDATGNEGYIETWNGSAWSEFSVTAASLASLSDPAASPNPDVNIVDVACASATTCFAAGSYEDGSNVQRGLVETGTFNGTSWTWVPTEVTPPGNADPSAPYVSVNGDWELGCAGSSTCEGVSAYDDSSGDQVGLIDAGPASGTWATSAAAPLPAGAASPDTVYYDGFTCVAATTTCYAAGGYVNNTGSGNTEGLFDTFSGGSWTATAAPLPAGASGSDPIAELGQGGYQWDSAVTCTSDGTCAAAGNYNTTGGDTEPLIEW